MVEMSYSTKPFEELDVLDNFLMNAIATDQAPKYRGIRMDVKSEVSMAEGMSEFMQMME